MKTAAIVVLALATWPPIACVPPGNPGTGVASQPSLPPIRPDSGDLIRPGFGHLKQEEISIRLDLTNVTVQLVPMEESVIRVLAPDSYSFLHKMANDKAPEIEQRARVHGLQERHVWMVTFFGLAPGATFTPGDLTITQGGREFRPLEIIPLTSGFGARLRVNESQRALYLFDDGLNVSQPLTVAMGLVQNNDWEGILRAIDLEKAVIRGRGGNR